MHKLVALAGSLRRQSASRKALQVAIDGARKLGGEVRVVDLAEPRLPLFEDGVTHVDPAVVQFRDAVRECDGLLIATPVYHDSYSGVLKNALDHLYKELTDKVVALIAVGGGRTGQGQALEHLRAVLRETSTWVIPRQVVVPQADTAFDASDRPTDPEVETRLTQLGAELVLRCRTMRPKRGSTG
ncbi:NAD(P)H-dependent oxidoreductase [Archangium sp.]|uniref:NADPH-dependent FMN reductase n=1 Tax=Archangium sp. TaxID=1872627 RepID=UPI00286ACC8D|nr:NAD(P)H-dependent oxidoreductase [Archangium sp.]